MDEFDDEDDEINGRGTGDDGRGGDEAGVTVGDGVREWEPNRPRLLLLYRPDDFLPPYIVDFFPLAMMKIKIPTEEVLQEFCKPEKSQKVIDLGWDT